MAKHNKPIAFGAQVDHKRTGIRFQPDEYLQSEPSWRFCFYDAGGKWTFTNEEFHNDILDHLIAYERMCWKDIIQASGGKSKGNGTNNHSIQVADIIKEARDRLNEIAVYRDELFSLRLTGKKRLWGFRVHNILNIIWYDSNHEIYPTQK